ncbi:MAG: hypothetical protein QW549_00590 [Candidatus Micrarchaeaceae archaeon]
MSYAILERDLDENKDPKNAVESFAIALEEASREIRMGSTPRGELRSLIENIKNEYYAAKTSFDYDSILDNIKLGLRKFIERYPKEAGQLDKFLMRQGLESVIRY